MSNISVIFEDEHILIVDKPAGLLMHPSWLDKREKDTLAGRVKGYLNGAKVHTVHRLDRPTSGLVVIAKSEQCARLLADQFLTRDVTKRYWAITRGFTPESFTVNHPLTEELDKIADKHASKDRKPQDAVSHFRRLGISTVDVAVGRYPQARYSLVECTPVTGRKHQIRRHLKHERFPIIGDTRYGCRHNNQAASLYLGIESLSLRAVQIEFSHPITHASMTINVSKDQTWKQRFDIMGWG